MTLSDLLKRYQGREWDILERMGKLYGVRGRELVLYRNALHEIEGIEPEVTGGELVLETVRDGESEFVLVSVARGGELWGADLSPWAEWLGWAVSPERNCDFIDLDIICHCLHEMTFWGRSQEDLDKVREAFRADSLKR